MKQNDLYTQADLDRIERAMKGYGINSQGDSYFHLHPLGAKTHEEDPSFVEQPTSQESRLKILLNVDRIREELKL